MGSEALHPQSREVRIGVRPSWPETQTVLETQTGGRTGCLPRRGQHHRARQTPRHETSNTLSRFTQSNKGWATSDKQHRTAAVQARNHDQTSRTGRS